ncbi:MAG: GWxTD domain-containing protein [Candidatus Marinimicrobia bacterium]|nr:GWxTD domain-containing protein [bacterium]MCG2715704.1 GWxTD domain-containing protein [Candidatus Neomarinimicrobiota bacterium]
MRIKIYTLSLIMLAMLEVGFAKDDNKPKYNEKSDIPFFYYEAITYPMISRDSIRLEVITKVPFDAIQFIKKDRKFTGRYEISILLLSEDDAKVASRIWRQELNTESYNETNSRELFDVNKVEFKVLPDKFLLTIGVLDLDTKKSSFRKKKIDVSHFYEKAITLSNINIIEQKIKNKAGETEDITSVEGTITDRKPEFTVSFDVLSEGGLGSIKYSIFDMDKKELLSATKEDTFVNGISKKQLEINKSKLGFAKYRISITINIGEDQIISERVFQLRWLGMSKLIDNLDDAIEQLKYITNTKVIKDLQKSKPKEKKEKFIKFWKQRDPSPATTENEIMNEYYKRIQYSNEHFSGFMDGWKTDMGMVFILFGPPNDIERHPFEIQSKPYEIWYYYEINRTFVFVDETGFGDYRLLTPYYENIYDRY